MATAHIASKLHLPLTAISHMSFAVFRLFYPLTIVLKSDLGVGHLAAGNVRLSPKVVMRAW